MNIMPSYRRLLLWVLIACACLSVGFVSSWTLNHLETVVEFEYDSYRGEAQKNPFLAVQRLLDSMDVSSRTSRHIPKFHKLSNKTILVWVEGRRPMSFDEAGAALAWIEQGGHFIGVSSHVANRETDEGDALLVKLDILQNENQLSTTDAVEKEQIMQPSSFVWRERDWQISFNRNYYLESALPLDWWIASEQGKHVLHRSIGEGAITWVSDLWWIQNVYIGQRDHASFFWHLLHQHHQPSHVQFVHGKRHTLEAFENKIRVKPEAGTWCEDCEEDAGFLLLLRRLWQHASTLLISAGVLLLLVIWAASQRFGSVLPVAQPVRRRLLEHIEASGRFYWKHRQVKTLLSPLRQQLKQEIALHHPGWEQETISKRVAFLAQLCQLSTDNVRLALYRHDIHASAELTQAVKLLKQIRNQL
ncbi:DUF4350 domain-containing protein [Candidatus Venteria ishoeyi]|uniref:DUF4350 domain-containing protein n=1 Tax=Candidatus Venteria ishoeyi TaxID=1899563 RepID=A0A1H6FB56_9GAMM|nr:DUF4350 domain-containing protein [Candidatus Venteria ishoeyi]SEH06611.1 Uncharacterised protein [Candidatus Venteria ishoeyi]